MVFKEIVDYVGVSSYPEEFDEIYKNIKGIESVFCDISYFVKYEKEYEILNEYYDMATKSIAEIVKDEKLYAYGKVLCEYAKTASTTEVRCAPMPCLDGTAARDFFALAVMYTTFPQAIEVYKERGYSDEDIKKAMKEVYIAIESSKKQLGRPVMMDVYYNWSMLYVYGEIFSCGGFMFQIYKFELDAMILQNKDTKECIPVMKGNKFHKDGLVLGSIGAEDEKDAFDAEFVENDNSYVGYEVKEGRVLKKRVEYKKAEWECILNSGDMVLSVHIPKNADVTHEAVKRDFAQAVVQAKKCFPEHRIKYIICCSWLLDFTLEKLLGENSKIVGFGKEFLRFPIMSKGTEYKMFVFPGHNGTVESLPENTTLQKKIKELILSGGHIHFTAGMYKNV